MPAFPIDLDGNSLPLRGKSNGKPESAATELKYILFWNNPMIGSVCRADGFPCAQTRQIGPFRRANRLLRTDGEGPQVRRLDPARVGQTTHKPQSFVAKYEAGERRVDVVEFVTICKAIGADPAKLLRALLKV
jgi:hypothetical protein